MINLTEMSGISRNAKTANLSATRRLPESRHLDFHRQASSAGEFHRFPTSAWLLSMTLNSLKDS